MVLTSEKLYDRMMSGTLAPEGKDMFRMQFFAMGTPCQIVFEAQSWAIGQEFQHFVLRWLAEFEAKYSRYQPDSMICEINRCAGQSPVAVDAEFQSMMKLCDMYFWRTKGIFDPTTLPLILLWDYKAEKPRIPDQQDITEALALTGWERVEHGDHSIYLPDEGMAIDVGGIGKEYAVDRVTEMAHERGIRNLLVDFGQDIRVLGQAPEKEPWRLGLEHPLDPGRCWGGVKVANRAVATSGSYLRHFEIEGKRYGHILDPRTGYPVQNEVLSVSVVAPTCTEAGILSTAAFILGPEDGMTLIESSYQAEGCIWTERHQIRSGRFDQYVIANTET